MIRKCPCAKCCHPICPPVTAEPPYDEVSHEIDNNIISIKVGKAGRFPPVNGVKPRMDVHCIDAYGKKCREGCAKVNVIPNESPPPKGPEEEMFLLRTIRQITPHDDLKNTLEIEFKAPRNYVPLPEHGPSPPIIVPKQAIKEGKKGRPKRSKGKKKREKK